ncbi:c-type cytochrome domain-containing protein [Aquirufa rosea]|uniref:Cytochrome C Planctomycete-type domain-containing protein n=1 Tax=Aquirufa rosea TaxID=2509241 RepID=A0A4Q1C0W3_9BACT|nr:c-type cytochrome domain-containing protein [Aquirufa rosea]RXK50660.1 hypothetical protein ESB04_03140 [Aquirufa rosea]
MNYKFLVVIGASLLVAACLSDKNTPTPTASGTEVVSGNSNNGSVTLPNSTSTCDTMTITFDKSVWPILQYNCTSCHSGAIISGGVDLSTYDKVISYVKNGKLYGAITHATGYSPMPSSTTRLSNCDINIIKKWIVGSYPSGSVLVNLNPTNPVNPVVTASPVVPPSNTTPTVTCDPNLVYFQQKVLPIIISNCAMSGCHDAVSRKDGVQLTDYSNIMKSVKAGDPNNSKLYKSIVRTDNERMPPPPMSPLSTDNKTAIFNWIKQGALNNSCDASASNCNTTNVSFSTTIQAILRTNCQGCHSGAVVSAGIDLSTYTNVMKVVTNGKLYGSVNHSTGFIPMPNASTKISSCEISQIKSWIDAGAKNN